MKPAEARLCVIKSTHVIFRASFEKSVMKLSSFELADYTMDAGRIKK